MLIRSGVSSYHLLLRRSTILEDRKELLFKKVVQRSSSFDRLIRDHERWWVQQLSQKIRGKVESFVKNTISTWVVKSLGSRWVAVTAVRSFLNTSTYGKQKEFQKPTNYYGQLGHQPRQKSRDGDGEGFHGSQL